MLKGLTQALADLEIVPEKLAVISGIGCSSRLPGYVKAYSFNSIHGRALPIATGLKVARPELTTIVVGGDGDGFSIGLGHIPHAVRRNTDLTYIVMDNGIYGLTKGQASPTTEMDSKQEPRARGRRRPAAEPGAARAERGLRVRGAHARRQHAAHARDVPRGRSSTRASRSCTCSRAA